MNAANETSQMGLREQPTLRCVAQALVKLETEEREVSDRRNGLHREIDGIYLRAPLGGADMVLLDRLEGLERRTSSERRVLHTRIDELRMQVGRAQRPPARSTFRDVAPNPIQAF